MNIRRYTWPVIIAAGLHGALLLSFPRDQVPVGPPVKKSPLPTREDARIQMIPEPVEETSDEGRASGAVDPLPKSIEIPPLEKTDNPFVISEIDRSAPKTPIANLDHIPNVVGNDRGILGTDIGTPRMPTPDRLDRHPRTMAQPAPQYPPELRSASVEGSVVVDFVVGMDGRVVRAEAVRWTHRGFVDPAVKAVLRWRFEPGTVDGRKVSFRMTVPIEFHAVD